MKPLFPIALALSLAMIGPSAPKAAAEDAGPGAVLTVEFERITTHQGSLKIGLFRSEEGWQSNDAVAEATIEVTGDQATAVFEGLEPGAYGLKIYQDVNGNGELDRNGWGIPSEPYAFSNNAPARFGPPSYIAAAFEVTHDGAVQTISIAR